ncbi:MAG: hypothetical protein HQL14_04350 [Candidatus Omnitrophica bacterium]|nr:hypothetical protein [Candidatus Omnitrophota bacterium]
MKNSFKAVFVLLFLSLLIVKPTPSYAWHGHDHEHTYIGVNFGLWPGGYYDHYYDPYYVRPYSPDYVVVSPSPSYQPVVINGVTYYVNNGAYYIYTAYGYQAVTPPVVASQPVVVSGPVTTVSPVVTQPAVTLPAPVAADTGDTVSVNVPNDKGGYTAVVLKQSGKGFVGPQGEFYSEFPKVSQLKLMYGK